MDLAGVLHLVENPVTVNLGEVFKVTEQVIHTQKEELEELPKADRSEQLSDPQIPEGEYPSLQEGQVERGSRVMPEESTDGEEGGPAVEHQSGMSQRHEGDVERPGHMKETVPRLVNVARPMYPALAFRAEIEGDVVVRFLVGKDGRVRKVEVMDGEKVFCKAAVAAVKEYVFEPAQQGERTVAAWVTQTVSFRLKKEH